MKIGKDIGIGAGHGIRPFELACGRGSYPQFNKEYCEALLKELKDKDIKSVLDFGCGNLETYKGYIDWNKTGIDYTGVDAHLGCIETCRERYPSLKFETHDVESSLFPKGKEGQAMIIKDVLIHWFNRDIYRFWDSVFDSYEYVFYMHSTTGQGYGTRDKRHGAYRYPGKPEFDEHFYGYKCVPEVLIPWDKVVYKQNIMGDSMKTLLVLKR